MEPDAQKYDASIEDLFRKTGSSFNGLTDEEAVRRKSPEKKKEEQWRRNLRLFFRQFRSPLVLILLISLILSSILGEVGNSLVIFSVLLLTGILSFVQEHNAGRAVERLRKMVGIRATVKRDGTFREIPSGEVVRGDIISLIAGDVIPGDGVIITGKDLYVNEAALTGESFPSEKHSAGQGKTENSGKVFRGTNVISGEGLVLVLNVGEETEVGQIEKRVGTVGIETAFEKGIRKFGYLIMRVSLIFTGIILAYNIVSGKPAQESFLFALAISVGLTPELLPSVVTITLSAGARRLAEKKVVVKRLASIQNLGAIDVLCSDKTGTLTEGAVSIHDYVSPDGKQNTKIRLFAYLNAKFESGFSNPIDDAIRKLEIPEVINYQKVDEVPYDFIRKRLSIVVADQQSHLMITKGSLDKVIEVCTKAELHDGSVVSLDHQLRAEIEKIFRVQSKNGYRVLGISCKDVTGDPLINRDDEAEMIFLGFILLEDPLKKGIEDTIDRVEKLGITLKLITGDNALIAHHVAQQLNIQPDKVLTGSDISHMSEDALAQTVRNIDIFAEIIPSQKERLVRALQRAGYTVGYIGDGINDASALKTADVGITVDNAVDVARDAADMVLLEKELHVLCDGVEEGRKTYLNTLKYILITTSANFGNMASMALASVLLPFLPLLPLQVLLVNFLTDIPSLAIASDRVDPDMLTRPRKWNMKLIWKFMLSFGIMSSLYDFLTFGVLYYVFHAKPEIFRTGWFIESVITELLVLFVIRSRISILKSRPGRWLAITSAVVFVAVFVFPYLNFASVFGLEPLSLTIALSVVVIAVVYTITGELLKRSLFRKIQY